jgi:hypothetical protein
MMDPEQLIGRFANEDKALRRTLDFVLDVFDQYRVFKLSPSKQHFIEISREIYYEAATESELEALQQALWWCYESAAEEQPNLLPPIQTMRLLSAKPFFDESTAMQGEIAAVLAYYQQLLTHSDTTLQLVATALLLAKHAAVTRVEQIFCNNECIVMLDAKRAFVQQGESFLILDAVGLLLWRRLKESQISADQLRLGYTSMYSHTFGSLRTLDDAVSVVGLMQQPMFSHDLNQISSPLSANDVVAHLTNQPLTTNLQTTNKPSRRRKRHVIFGMRESVKAATALAFSHRQDDGAIISELSLCLRRFQQQSPKEHRNCRAFKDCKAALEKLLLKRCSAVCGAVVHYCISLFLHGSAWKARLAVNTVLTYLSTLQQFCVCVLSDETLLQEAQSQNDALTELTELIEYYLVTRPADKQNTVLIFLQCVSEYLPLRLVGESLDVFSEKVATVRTHYLSPLMFERAISDVPNVSSRWFLNLCYFLGLRHDEAANLFVDDVTPDFIYVTKRSKRKSHCAIRRISLMFMPHEMRLEFLKFVAMRRQHSTRIFSMRVIYVYLPNALSELRKQAGNNQFVVHSLRHCAANNMLFMLCIAAFEVADWRERYALFQHQLFSDDSISQLKTQCLNIGHPLLPQSPIFNILACKLGHASPVVSASCYLHFLPFVEFELNALRNKAPSFEMLAALLPANSYRYHFLSDQNFDETKWFKHACRGLPKATARNVVDTQADVNTFSFSDYVMALHDFLTTNQSSMVFQRSQDVPPINATTLTRMLEQPSTLRRIEFMSQQHWTAKSARALCTLQDVLINDLEIRDVRTLRHVLFAMNSIGLFKLQAVVRTSKGDMSSAPIAWSSLAQRFDCYLQFESSSHQGFSISISSFHSCQKPIPHFSELIQLICSYIYYLGNSHD